jgi:hypothetical protein
VIESGGSFELVLLVIISQSSIDKYAGAVLKECARGGGRALKLFQWDFNVRFATRSLRRVLEAALLRAGSSTVKLMNTQNTNAVAYKKAVHRRHAQPPLRCGFVQNHHCAHDRERPIPSAVIC